MEPTSFATFLRNVSSLTSSMESLAQARDIHAKKRLCDPLTSLAPLLSPPPFKSSQSCQHDSLFGPCDADDIERRVAAEFYSNAQPVVQQAISYLSLLSGETIASKFRTTATTIFDRKIKDVVCKHLSSRKENADSRDLIIQRRRISTPMLIDVYRDNPRPCSDTKAKIAIVTGKTTSQVNKWFQNRRTRIRKALQKRRPVAGIHYEPIGWIDNQIPELSESVLWTQPQYKQSQGCVHLPQSGIEELDVENASVISDEDDEDWEGMAGKNFRDSNPEHHPSHAGTSSHLEESTSFARNTVPISGGYSRPLKRARFQSAAQPLPFSGVGDPDLDLFAALLQDSTDDVADTTRCQDVSFATHVSLPSYPYTRPSTSTKEYFSQHKRCWKRKAGGGDIERAECSFDEMMVDLDEKMTLRPTRSLPRRSREPSRSLSRGSSVALQLATSAPSCSNSSSRSSSVSPSTPQIPSRKIKPLPTRRPYRNSSPPTSLTSTPALSRSSSSSSCDSTGPSSPTSVLDTDGLDERLNIISSKPSIDSLELYFVPTRPSTPVNI